MLLLLLLEFCDENDMFCGPDKLSILSNSISNSLFAPLLLNELAMAHMFQLLGLYQLLELDSLLEFELLFSSLLLFLFSLSCDIVLTDEFD